MQHVYTFDNLGTFINMVDVPKPGNAASDTAWKNHDNTWSGGTRAEAFDMARNGWREGREKMVKAMAQARPAVSLPPAFTLDVAGAYPDPCAAAAGAPDCMVNLDPTESRIRPIVRIAVNIWASAAYSADEFMNYGAAIMSYLDAVEASGFRVELTMLCHCKIDRGVNQGQTYSGRVLIKRAEEPLDIDRATFCLTHPAMFRRLWFTHMQIAPGAAGCMPGCGYPRNPEPGDLEAGQLVTPGINVLRPGSKDLRTPKDAAERISEMMETVLSEAGVDMPKLAFGGEGSK